MLRTPIVKNSELEAFIDQLRKSELLAIDTEADSLFSYRARVCLIQIGDGQNNWIIDPLADLDLGPLIQLLQERSLLLHGCDYDLRMLRQEFRFQAKDVYDTMIGARYLNLSHIGYAALVQEAFGVELDKSSQKADWSKRPIPEKMLTYAAQDTEFLHEIACRQQELLLQKGKLDWVREHCALLVDEVNHLKDSVPDPDAFRIKGSHTLRPKELGMLRELWQWREARAEEKNIPSFKVLGNEKMLEWSCFAATRKTIKSTDLYGAPRNFTSEHLHEIAASFQKVHALSEAELPKMPGRKLPPPAPNPQLMEKLKIERDQLAKQFEIDPSLIGNKQQMVTMAFSLEKGFDSKQIFEAQKRDGHWMQWQQNCWEPIWKAL